MQGQCTALLIWGATLVLGHVRQANSLVGSSFRAFRMRLNSDLSLNPLFRGAEVVCKDDANTL